MDVPPDVLRMLDYVAEKTKESGSGPSGGGALGGGDMLTPDQAKDAYEKFMKDNQKVLTGQEGSSQERQRAIQKRAQLAKMAQGS